MKRKIALFLILADGLLLLHWGGRMEDITATVVICMFGVLLLCFARPYWKGFTPGSLFEGVTCFLSVSAFCGFLYGVSFADFVGELLPEMPTQFVYNAVSLLSLLSIMVIYRFLIRVSYYLIYQHVEYRKPLRPISRIVLIAAALIMFSLLSHPYLRECLNIPALKDYESLSMVFFTVMPVIGAVLFYMLLKFVAGVDKREITHDSLTAGSKDIWPERFRGTYIGD